jgi:glycosyltransferase involved in cell wall biosynthesis
MLVNIFLHIKQGPYGGGNQFLKALREFLILQNIYTDDPQEADLILFNSHHQIKDLIRLKRKYPEKIFVHRIDGPVSMIRKSKELLDSLIYRINKTIADAAVFQSEWSKRKNIELGMGVDLLHTIIMNAPDPKLFNRIGKREFYPDHKLKIIASSWAKNMSKGFGIYQYLDEHLDSQQYEMTFCGNSPVEFKHIIQKGALSDNELAIVLKDHDIFLTASENDPCSNALIEALHCGLPAVALNDGGHPEIIKKGGITFSQPQEIPDCLNYVKENYKLLQQHIDVPDMSITGKRYVEFLSLVYTTMKTKGNVKRINFVQAMLLYSFIYLQKILHQIHEFFS